MKKDAILAALPNLTRPDLEAVQALASHLLGQRPKNAPTATADKAEGLLFDALCAVLGVRLVFGTMAKGDTYKQWCKHAPEALGFFDKHFELVMSKQVLALALMRFVLSLLVRDLRNRKVPVSLGSVIVNLGRVPEVFENSFPGYIESGAAHLVLASIKGA